MSKLCHDKIEKTCIKHHELIQKLCMNTYKLLSSLLLGNFCFMLIRKQSRLKQHFISAKVKQNLNRRTENFDFKLVQLLKNLLKSKSRMSKNFKLKLKKER